MVKVSDSAWHGPRVEFYGKSWIRPPRFGLAAPGGVFSETGIAGLTLGGGFGWLRNKFGLSCDNLISARVVTADGSLITASADENSDLLWGLRGGGGNIGIVTRFEYRLHPTGPEVMFCFVFHPGEEMEQGFRFYRDFMRSSPDEVSSIAFSGIIPPGSEAYPKEIHGRPYLAFGACYAGPVEEGSRVLEPLRSFTQTADLFQWGHAVCEYAGSI